MASSILPLELGLGAGSAAVIVPSTLDPAGITTCPEASFTSWPTVAVNASPALADRVLIESLAVSPTRVPAARVRVVGAAGLGAGALGAGVVAFFSGTSFIAADDSVGASVRLRAVESARCADCSPLAQANAVAARATARYDQCFCRILICHLYQGSLAPNIGESPLELYYHCFSPPHNRLFRNCGVSPCR